MFDNHPLTRGANPQLGGNSRFQRTNTLENPFLFLTVSHFNVKLRSAFCVCRQKGCGGRDVSRIYRLAAKNTWTRYA